MTKRNNKFAGASALRIAFSTALLSVSVILLAIAAPNETRTTLGQDWLGFELKQADPPILGNYPSTSLSLSTNTTVTPDGAPTNTTRIDVSTSTNFKGRLEGYPATGVVRVTDAHPAGTYTVTVKAFDSGGATATKTFTLAVTTPVACTPPNLTWVGDIPFDILPVAFAIGDFNRDGTQDLAVASYAFDNVKISFGSGTGLFSFPFFSFKVGVSPISVAVGDFNGDGHQDLAVANYSSNDVSILLGSDSLFGVATSFAVGTGPISVAVGDFNGDGKQDLAVANYDSNNVSILLGDGAGNFGPPTSLGAGSGPQWVAVGDFNGDGKQDLAVLNYDSNNVSILLGNGAGGFSAPMDFAVGSHPFEVAVGDFNGDGKQDLAAANVGSSNVSVLLGNGAGSFGAATNFGAGTRPGSIAVGDFNGDGKQDLALANRGSNDVSILLGSGAGNFGAPTNFPAGTVPAHVVVGDFTSDGKQDLAISNQNSDDVSILLNGCPPPLSATGSTFQVESCAPPNGVIDPGETVTISFCVQNTSSSNTTNLVGTVQPTGFVTNPSGPQSYGVVTAGGPAVCRNFTFTVGANALCGDNLTATIHFQDGVLDFGNVTYSFWLGSAGTLLNEGFNDITALVPAGWFMQNNSQPLGSTGWFQGNTQAFSAQAGPASSYIAANYANGSDVATISNWLLTPPMTLQNGATLVFWTRTFFGVIPDRLQVRMSLNGSSTNVGSTAMSVGDFVTVLLDINPNYTTSGYPSVWTQFTVFLSGIPSPTMGRLAFRYFVENGGTGGDNSDYIGIDTVSVRQPAICCQGVAPTVTSAVSRKNHGLSGAFGIDLPLTGTPGIECRTSGATNDYSIVVTFASAVTVNGNPQAQVISGTGTVGSGGVSNGGMVTISGNSVIVPVTNVANAQTINVRLNSVTGSSGSGNITVPMSTLVGDTNANGAVNSGDVAQTKARLGQTLDTTNFRSDVNANGAINAGDVSQIKSLLGTGLP